jgi:hypothetical protein
MVSCRIAQNPGSKFLLDLVLRVCDQSFQKQISDHVISSALSCTSAGLVGGGRKFIGGWGRKSLPQMWLVHRLSICSDINDSSAKSNFDYIDVLNVCLAYAKTHVSYILTWLLR